MRVNLFQLKLTLIRKFREWAWQPMHTHVLCRISKIEQALRLAFGLFMTTPLIASRLPLVNSLAMSSCSCR